MLTTVMPWAFAWALSTTSVPVAATAMSLRSGSCFSTSARIGTLLMRAISAPLRRWTVSSGVQVESYSA